MSHYDFNAACTDHWSVQLLCWAHAQPAITRGGTRHARRYGTRPLRAKAIRWAVTHFAPGCAERACAP